MAWLAAAAPLLAASLLGWIALGWVLAEAALGVRERSVVTALALPLGMASHALLANAACHLAPLPRVASLLPWCEIGLAAVACSRGWLRMPRIGGRGLAIAAVGGVVLLGDVVLQAREVWVDDSGHAAMAQLLAAGQYPLRFPCNPGLAASYAYGGDLLAATVSASAGVAPWEAMDVVRPAALAGAIMLAMAVGWSASGSSAAGPLAALLLLTTGPMVWVLFPLCGRFGELVARSLPGLEPLVRAVEPMTASAWSLAVATPGFITPVYAHTQRSLSWVFAPLLPLLALLLLESGIRWRRLLPAVALLVSAAALLHVAVLVLLVPMLVAYAGLMASRSSSRTGALRIAALVAALAAGLALAAWQGGELTDWVADRLAGRFHGTTSVAWAFPQLPSCRGTPPTLACAALSVLNLGVVPFMIPWVLVRLRARPGSEARLALLAGCLVSYAVPFCFRYAYSDWNLQRLISYASWMVAVLALPLALQGFAAGSFRRRAAWLVALLLASTSGVATLAIVVSGRGVKDAISEEFAPLPSPLDMALMPLAGRIPLAARFFDPSGCLETTGTRPGYLFGRYLLGAADRLRFGVPLPVFAQVAADPQPETVANSGYTHLYVDSGWYYGLSPAARDGLARAPVRVMGVAGNAADFRALLAVCPPGASCNGFVPVRDLPR